jgi:dsDNA-specific endonuclease/ATPase MutS2
MKLNKKQAKVLVESLAAEFMALDIERQRIERESRQLRKKLDELKEGLQGVVGIAEELDVPFVTRIGNYYITQIKKHRDVDAYSYDFIDFKVVDSQ